MRRLTDEEVADVLTENGIGVLAMHGRVDGTPYPIPVAFGYDPDEDLFVLHLEGDTDSYKHRCLQRSRTVGFTVYEETEPRTRWRSVVVSGDLVETSYQEAEAAFAVLAKNTQFAPKPPVWGDTSDVTPFELRIEEWSGREFHID
jgi:nitroimidazol reductase NimA-like FMN-containing flavoprotein (pyridoxamine 5'-phosphate oxidase superfamily)